MKRKYIYCMLTIEAILCILLCSGLQMTSKAFTTVIAFPFEPAGRLLRNLSLSGTAGNILAIILYGILCLIPVALLLRIHHKRKLYLEDSLLVLLSAVLFVVLYLMINPGEMYQYLGESIQTKAGITMLGVIVYSVIVGYGVIRLVRLFAAADRAKMHKYLSIWLVALNVIFIYMIFGVHFRELVSAISNLRTSNTGNESVLGLSYVFLVLQYIVDVLPYILDLILVFMALDLIRELIQDRYSERSVIAGKSLSRMCCYTLSITVVSDIVFNVLQLIFMRHLYVVNTFVNLPLLSILFVLIMLLVTQFLHENKQLKDDNDMFI